VKDLLHIALNNEKLIFGIGIQKEKSKQAALKEWLESKPYIKTLREPARKVSKFSLGSLIFYCSEENPLASPSVYVQQLKKITHNGMISPIDREPSDVASENLNKVFERIQDIAYTNPQDDPLRNWKEGESVVLKRDLSPAAVKWNEFVKEKSFGTKLIPFEL
jgi:hypothetical protein